MSSKKRPREQPAAGTRLIEIYDDLSNIDEKIRLKACHALLTTCIFEGHADGHQLNEILRRLLRGLCSGRKAARLGFSVALTQLLIELLGPRQKKVAELQTIPDLIQTLQKQTHVSGNVSGQEERDHQFGRLFGAESIIKSGILFQPHASEDSWAQALDLVYELANKKPWLREECGFVLFNAIKIVRDQDPRYAQMILEKLRSEGLAKTPEGIAIWVAAKAECPNLQFPRHVWKHDDPLHSKEKSEVARILKEGIVVESIQDNAEAKSGRGGAWNSKLHFAWNVIMARLLHVEPQIDSKKAKIMSFAEFWEECIDNTLFATTSSEERKFWGFLLFQNAMKIAPSRLIPSLFTQNFMRCLTNQLSSSERYLHRAAEKSTKSMIQRVNVEPKSRIEILRVLLTPPLGSLNFDKITKTKTFESLLSDSSQSDIKEVIALYEELLLRPGVQDEKEAATRRLALADQLASTIRNMRVESPDSADHHSEDTAFIENVLRLFSRCAYFDLDSQAIAHNSGPSPPFAQSTRNLLRTRISSCLAHTVAKRVDAAEISFDLIHTILGNDEPNSGAPLLEADETISQIIKSTWKSTKKAKTKLEKNFSDPIKGPYYRSLVLLYSLTILQVYNEDADAIGILEELNECFKGLLHQKSIDGKPALFVEVLLSFASKPSQLFRHLTQQVFTAFAPKLDETGLESMLKVLETKENLSGQAEMFEHNDSDGSRPSDIEEIELSEAGSADTASGGAVVDGTDESSNSGYDSESADDDLAAIDAKLEQAVATRHVTKDMDMKDNSSSDEDMDDDQMEAFDQQLEQVFRERKKLINKKSEKKDAKENIVNFKSRVLDLLEIYVKQQHANALALNVLLPTLNVIRMTSSPQISSKACNFIRTYSRLCKGEGVPKITDHESVLQRLESVHAEAGKEASNAHGSACSQASLLLVRILVARDREHLRRVVSVYARTQERSLFDPSCKVKTPFFTDWLNWCTSAKT